MPSKIQLDENLWFLYVCLQKSDFKAIDFNAVGEATGLKAPAARMRYTRLRRHIVDGTLIGTHGTPFQGGPERVTQTQGKRKKECHDAPVKGEDQSPGFIETRSGTRIERRVKSEQETSDEYESDTEDEEDDMPLAKRRNTRGESTQDSAEHAVSTQSGTASHRSRQTQIISAARPGSPSKPQIKVETPLDVFPELRIADKNANRQIADREVLLDQPTPLQDHAATKLSTSPKTSFKSRRMSALPENRPVLQGLGNQMEKGVGWLPESAPRTKPDSPSENGGTPNQVQMRIKIEEVEEDIRMVIKEEVEDEKLPSRVMPAQAGMA